MITTNRESTKWRISSSILVAALVAQTYFLLHDVPLLRAPNDAVSTQGLRAPPIAEMVQKKNSVQVQNPGELLWIPSQDGQTLYRRQSILTLENSQADIAFLDGTGLVLDENSLIQLEKRPSDDSLGYQRIVVTLVRGTLHKREPRKKSELLRKLGTEEGTTPPLEIRVGNASAIPAADGELTVVANPEISGGHRIEVQNGEVRIQTPQADVVIHSGEQAVIGSADSQESAVANKMAISLLSPRGGETISDAHSQTEVQFRWNSDPGLIPVGPMDLEISPDRGFRFDVRKLRIKPTHSGVKTHQATLMLPVPISDSARGTWFWRVRPLQGNGPGNTADLPVERFTIRGQGKPIPELPLNGAKFIAGKAIDFVWSSVVEARGYELALWSESVPKGNTSPEFAPTPRFRVEKLPPGQYQWRIRAKRRDGTLSGWSEIRRLRVFAEGAPELTAPPPPAELEDAEIESQEAIPREEPSPIHSRIWRKVWDLIVPVAFAEAGTESRVYHFRLKWSPVKGASKYRIQIGRQSTFKTIIAETEVAEPTWVWEYQLGMENSKGRVFYRVASASASGRYGPYSSPKPIPIPASILASAKRAAETPVVPEVPKMEEPQPTAPPAHTLASPPPPVAEPKRSTLTLSAAAFIHTGYGSMSQTSGASNLASVSIVAPYIQQKIGLGIDLIGEPGLEPFADIPYETRHWTAQIQSSFAGFHKPDTPRTTVQPDVKAFKLRVDILRWVNFAGRTDPWRIGLGATVDRSFRWVKTGPQTLDPQGSISLGPTAYAVRNYPENTGIAPSEWGGALALPVTGILTGGQLSAQAMFWGEWKLTRIFDRQWIGLRMEAQPELSYWSVPTNTLIFTWAFWIAPSIHFGGTGSRSGS